MSVLAHDQNWSEDDWITLAIFPPGMFVLCMALFAAIAVAVDGHRGQQLVTDLKFSAGFLGVICGGAWIIIWALVGIAWLAGGL